MMEAGWKQPEQNPAYRFAFLFCAMMKAPIVIGCIAAVVTVCAAFMPAPVKQDPCLRTFPDRSLMQDSLPEAYNGFFASSGKCDHCHGLDPAGIASIDQEGADVNVVDDWRSTLMGNSARDPFWRAQVSHETTSNPLHVQPIETKCTSCHAPLGHFAAMLNGAESYAMAELLEDDSVAIDGVSCVACHQQDSVMLGVTHSGNLHYVSAPVAFGPYPGPLVTPMALSSGYTPEFSPHISRPGLCAACHTLITETIDTDGNLTPDTFVEQATYHEWLNSVYDTDHVSCQACHMPVLQDQAVILAAGYDTPPRAPYALHTLAGANVFMLRLMKANLETLGIPATAGDFDQTISATLDMLQQQSLALSVDQWTRSEDTLFLSVKLKNLAGHKLPTGFPSRRLSLGVRLQDEAGNTIFHSGAFDMSDFSVVGEDQPFEPHHQVITSEDQVQLYEMVMGDTDGNRTALLTRGAIHLKDNRLVPAGFTVADVVYDTTAIVGHAANDPDFNADPLEGSGTDLVHYHIALQGYTGPLELSVEAHYQALPPVWANGLFTTNTPPVDTFSSMFDAADRAPVLMQSENLQLPGYVGMHTPDSAADFQVWTGWDCIHIVNESFPTVRVFDTSGKLLWTCGREGYMRIPVRQGVYLVQRGNAVSKVVVR